MKILVSGRVWTFLNNITLTKFQKKISSRLQVSIQDRMFLGKSGSFFLDCRALTSFRQRQGNSSPSKTYKTTLIRESKKISFFLIESGHSNSLRVLHVPDSMFFVSKPRESTRERVSLYFQCCQKTAFIHTCCFQHPEKGMIF